MLVPNLPAPLPVKWLNSVGITHVGPIAVQDFDYIHVIIYTSEMIRSGLMGPATAITTGFAFGVPPIIHFGSPELQKRFLPDLLSGRTRICIAITEPDAGSDVSTHDPKMLYQLWRLTFITGCERTNVRRENSRWKAFHCERHQEVDYQRNVERICVHVRKDRW
jgi:acyl-CoA dehydrogenase